MLQSLTFKPSLIIFRRSCWERNFREKCGERFFFRNNDFEIDDCSTPTEGIINFYNHHVQMLQKVLRMYHLTLALHWMMQNVKRLSADLSEYKNRDCCELCLRLLRKQKWLEYKAAEETFLIRLNVLNIFVNFFKINYLIFGLFLFLLFQNEQDTWPLSLEHRFLFNTFLFVYDN